MNKNFLMAEDFFLLALILSLTAHLTVGGGSMFIKKEESTKVKTRKMEVLYSKPKKEEPKPELKKPKPVEDIPLPEKVEKITLHDSLSSVVLVKEHVQQQDPLKVYERVPDKVRSFNMAAKKTVSVPPLQSEKINNPSYANYYSLVRGRIKQRAYFNYSEYYAGEVYLTFILTKDGTLKELQILEQRTTGGQYLRTIGLKSVKEAVPFPPFPKELNYPELTFNVVISFQVREDG
jgi:outer membrane biosynthesis protein TonB